MTDTLPLPPDSPLIGLAEEAVELAALSWFELLGWRSVPVIISHPMAQWVRGLITARLSLSLSCEVLSPL